MSTIRVRLALRTVDAEAGRVQASGAVQFRPSARRVDDGDVVLPKAFTQVLRAGEDPPVVSFEVDDAATWAWEALERVANGRTDWVTFTVSDVAPAPGDNWDAVYCDLTLVDPDSLTPLPDAPETVAEAIEAVAGDIADETSARITADGVLQTAIDGKASTGALSTEATTRGNADTALGNRVTPLETLTASGRLSETSLNGAYVARPQVEQPRHLRRWTTVLATAGQSQAVVTVLGDSITLGAYAGGTTDTDWRKSGYVSHMRRRIQAIYGDVGSGHAKMAEDLRITLSGGSGSGTTGPCQQGRSIGAGNTVTLVTDEACTGFQIAYWNQGGAFTYNIDGAGAVTVTPTGTDVMALATVTGLSDTTHTIVLTGTGTAHIGSIRPTRGSNGVVVNRFGRSGMRADTGTGSSQTTANGIRQRDATFKVNGTHLAVMMFGANDIPAGTTPANFRAALKVGTDYVTALGGCSLLVAGPRYTEIGASSAYPQEDYYDAMSNLAATDDHVAYFDLATVWGTYEDANAADCDFMYDTIHPNALGHHSIGNVLAEIVLGRQRTIA